MLKVSARRLVVYGVFLLIAGSYAIRGFRAQRALAAGDPVPSFEATLDNGQRLDLRKAPGRIVVLTFWASWCEPCRREAPILNGLQSQALVVGVSLDDADAQATALLARGIGIRFPVVGGRPDLAQLFALQSVPATYVIAADGTLTYAHLGVVNGGDLEEAIDKAKARKI